MIKYVNYRQSELAGLPYLTIDVDVYWQFYDNHIAAGKVANIIKPDGELDEQAYLDYMAFIEEAEYRMVDVGLKILQRTVSQSFPNTSHYYTLCNERQYENDTMKYIIFLRISDHTPKLTPEQIELVRKKRTNTANAYGVKWKLAYFLVNKSKFIDYDQAIEEMERLAKDYMRRLENKG